MSRKASLVGLTLFLVAGTVIASAQEKRPLSPPGTASAMVGGTWTAPNKDGERTYSGGKRPNVAACRHRSITTQSTRPRRSRRGQ